MLEIFKHRLARFCHENYPETVLLSNPMISMFRGTMMLSNIMFLGGNEGQNIPLVNKKNVIPDSR